MRTVVRIKQKPFEALIMRFNGTYKGFAKKLNISRVYLSQIKNEKNQSYYPSGELRTKILGLLQCKFDDVFKVTQVPEGNSVYTPKNSVRKNGPAAKRAKKVVGPQDRTLQKQRPAKATA